MDAGTLAGARVCGMRGRIPVGQGGFSPGGRLFAFIHAGRALFRHAVAGREALRNMRQFAWAGGLQASGSSIPCSIGIIETATGGIATRSGSTAPECARYARAGRAPSATGW